MTDSRPHRSRSAGPLGRALLGGLLLLATATAVEAQQAEISLEAGASRILPPASVGGDAARFLVGGFRGQWTSAGGSALLASLMGGRSAEATTGGDFLSGELGGTAWLRVGRRWALGLRGRGLAFWVGEPFPYRAAAAEGGPSLLISGKSVSLRLDGLAGVGRSHMEFETLLSTGTPQWPGGHGHRMGGSGPGGGTAGDSLVVTVVDSDLWRYGGTAELMTRLGPLVAGATAGVHRSAGGTFQVAGLRLAGGGDRVTVGARADSWWTPAGRETTAALSLSLRLTDGWDVRGFFGKTEPDPLTLAASSGGGGGVLLARRLVGPDDLRGTTVLYETLERKPSGATVRFHLRTSGDADSVQVVGDFTLWEGRTMDRDGALWTVELEVPEGVHHFGFLVDGDWYVPEDARDAVPDEWGRRSATLVVEGENGR